MVRALKFIKKVEGLYYLLYVVKTKALISFAVTAKLIFVFVFANAKKLVFSRRGPFVINCFYVGVQCSVYFNLPVTDSYFLESGEKEE